MFLGRYFHFYGVLVDIFCDFLLRVFILSVVSSVAIVLCLDLVFEEFIQSASILSYSFTGTYCLLC